MAPPAGDSVPLQEQACALCGEARPYRVLYPPRLPVSAIDERIFSARRPPDKVHYRMVRCDTCGLVYSNPILPAGYLDHLYRLSHFTYGDLTPYLRRTYRSYLRLMDRYGAVKGRLLDIGCGDGFMLEEALQMGYRHACGVEPSGGAVAAASSAVRGNIINEPFRRDLFPPGSVDVLCSFQTLDHIRDPNRFLRDAWMLLAEGGLMLLVLHDLGALSSRLLGELSPIVDIEHTCLFDRQTIQALCRKNGFTILNVKSVTNGYPLSYWCSLLPLPGRLRESLAHLLLRMRLGRLEVRLRAGNMSVIARKETENPTGVATMPPASPHDQT